MIITLFFRILNIMMSNFNLGVIDITVRVTMCSGCISVRKMPVIMYFNRMVNMGGIDPHRCIKDRIKQ